MATEVLSNCYSESLNSPGLGELKPGGLALTFGEISIQTYQTLWPCEERLAKHPRVYLGACLSGVSLDGAQLLMSPLPPATSPEKYHLALFMRERPYLDFHFAFSKPGMIGWHHAFKVQYGDGEQVFIVEEAIDNPGRFETEGLHGQQLQAFAEIPPGLHRKLGF